MGQIDPYDKQVAIEHQRLQAENRRLREALKSIAANTCCDKCQEAALVAIAALKQEKAHDQSR